MLMKTDVAEKRTYLVDRQGYLRDFDSWDEEFAILLAPRLKIEAGLTERHWDVIRFIRDAYRRDGKCPSMYDTCRACGLFLRDLGLLFPTGYIRGACKLAGLSYREAYLKYSWAEAASMERELEEAGSL
jgi:tRNA 2-thiouridine synthesizing protein E